MDKRHLHHFWRRLRPIKPIYFLLLAVVFGLISVFALRQNNLNMIKLRTAVYQADEQNGDIEGALRNLREYVYAHMNTSLTSGNNSIYPPIQLKHEYERLVAERAAASSNEEIYTQAQAECEKRFPAGLSGSGRIPCIQEYVASRGAQTAEVPSELYQFDFVSPRWTPDLAGLSLIAAGLFTLLAIGTFITDRIIIGRLKD